MSRANGDLFVLFFSSRQQRGNARSQGAQHLNHVQEKPMWPDRSGNNGDSFLWTPQGFPFRSKLNQTIQRFSWKIWSLHVCHHGRTHYRQQANKKQAFAYTCRSCRMRMHVLTATGPEARKSFTGTFLGRLTSSGISTSWRHYLWQPIAITRSRAQVWVFHLPNHWSSIDSCCSLHLLTATMLSATLHSCLHFAASFFMWL